MVTGANKGIGFAICRELASKGTAVVLTARDETRGLEAVEKLERSEPGLSRSVTFHKLDVTDPASIAALREFVKSRFGRLDILVSPAPFSFFQYTVLRRSSMSANYRLVRGPGYKRHHGTIHTSKIYVVHKFVLGLARHHGARLDHPRGHGQDKNTTFLDILATL